MSTILKTALLDALRQQNNSHLEDARNIFQHLGTTELLRPAAGGGWSIAQCLEHLNSYGVFYLPLLKETLARSSGRPKRYFRSGWLGNYFARSMDPQTGKRKMKAFKNHTPPGDLDASKVVATFIRQLEELDSCLDAASQADLDKRLPISIAAFIRLKAGDVFRFLMAHNERHIQQAKRNLPS